MGLFDKLFGKKDGAQIDASAPLPVTDRTTEKLPSDNGIANAQTREATLKKKGDKSKRKTLPKNFKEIIKAGDIAALKVVFDECELDARGDYYQMTALSYFNVPGELVRWLVEQGADINAPDRYQNTPLHKQAGSAIAEILLDLGADVEARNKDGETPLHTATGRFNPCAVRLLIERGADINAETKTGNTPLAKALLNCMNSDIACMAKVAEIFLEAGVRATPGMSESVRRIGKDFEFHRAAFSKNASPECLSETEAGLTRLYALFHAEPILRRSVHDGVSPITVIAARWQDQHEELWNFLVPSSGHARTVQGEAVRIAGRISNEILDNGGVNWDGEYRKMLDALVKYFSMGTPLSPQELSEAAELSKQLRGNGTGDNEPARLTELSVRWVLANPNPISLDTPDYKR
jgi:hypothetical protein